MSAHAFAAAVASTRDPRSSVSSFSSEIALRERGRGLGSLDLSRFAPSNTTQYATTGGGAVYGAVLGTVIFPVVGTIIGAGIGAVAGLLAGSAISKTVSGHQQREAELAPALASQASLVQSLQDQYSSLASLLQQVTNFPISVQDPPDGGAGLAAIQETISQVAPQVQSIQSAIQAMNPSEVYQDSDPAAPSNQAQGLQQLMASLAGQLRSAQSQIWSWQEGQIAAQHASAAAASAPPPGASPGAPSWTADHQVNGAWVDAQGRTAQMWEAS
jgi:outer membrane lipoprotein SlyB